MASPHPSPATFLTSPAASWRPPPLTGRQRGLGATQPSPGRQLTGCRTDSRAQPDARRGLNQKPGLGDCPALPDNGSKREGHGHHPAPPRADSRTARRVPLRRQTSTRLRSQLAVDLAPGTDIFRMQFSYPHSQARHREPLRLLLFQHSQAKPPRYIYLLRNDTLVP